MNLLACTWHPVFDSHMTPRKCPTFSPDYCMFMFWAQIATGLLLASAVAIDIQMHTFSQTFSWLLIAMITTWTVAGLVVWICAPRREVGGKPQLDTQRASGS